MMRIRRWGATVQLSVLLGALFAIFSLGLVGAPGNAAAAPAPTLTQLLPSAAGPGKVESRDIKLDVRRDGSMRVTETEVITFPPADFSQAHGITRNILVGQQIEGDLTQYRRYPLSDLKVSSPSGAPVDLKRSDSTTEVALRIGNPDRTVGGTQTYVLSYTLGAVMNEVQGSDKGKLAELYWNVLSAENPQDIGKLTVSMSAPASPLRTACVAGRTGATRSCSSGGDKATSFALSSVRSGVGVTVSGQYPVTAFAAIKPDLAADSQRIAAWSMAGAGLTIPALAAAAMGVLVRRRGRDEHYEGVTPGLTPGVNDQVRISRGPVREGAVQFTPPAGVHPGMVGTIIDERADSVDVSATMIDLAVRGYLTIAETQLEGEQDWTLTRNPDADQGTLSRYEQVILDETFAEAPMVDGKPTTTMGELQMSGTAMPLTKDALYDEVVRRGWFNRRPDSVRGFAWFPALFLFVLAGIALFGLAAKGATLGGPFGGLPGAVPLAIGLALAGILIGLIGRHLPSRTADGSAVLTQSLGFKRYLMTAEANQIKFEEAQSLFSRYLPYAIVFGVQSQWAATFEEVAQRAAAAGTPLPAPVWYYGTYPGSGFTEMTNSMDSFNTKASTVMAAATAGASGASGWSGGSFGGSVGGGGGGSFGGSW